MAGQEKWDLGREEIEARLRKQNQEQNTKGLTRGEVHNRSALKGLLERYFKEFNHSIGGACLHRFFVILFAYRKRGIIDETNKTNPTAQLGL